jgi:vacuolar protein sorting-associated protein 3
MACVANAERYDLMDLERGERIPVFPINPNAESSEDVTSTEPSLPPLMVSVGKEDFLVTTGTSIKDPAMGVFVDLNGDPVRGTLAFSSYPRAMSKSSLIPY